MPADQPLDAHTLIELPRHIDRLVSEAKGHEAAARDKEAMAADCYREQEEAEDRFRDALCILKPYEAMVVNCTPPGATRVERMAYRIDGDGLLERITLVDPGELARRIGAAGKVERSSTPPADAPSHSVNPVVVPLEPIEDALRAEFPRIDFGPVDQHTGRTLRAVSRTLASTTIGPFGYPAAMSDESDESEGN